MQAFLACFSHFFKKAPLLKEQLPCSDFFKEETRRKKAKYGKVEVIDQGGFLQWKIVFFVKSIIVRFLATKSTRMSKSMPF
jgi:histidine triad (HIT) family protein